MIELHQAKADLGSVVTEIRDFTSSRQNLASIGSEQDLRAVAQVFDVNRRTRTRVVELTKPDHPPLDQERIEDASGSEDE